MDEIKKVAGQITGIHTESISMSESFIDFSARFASMPGTTVLMSGGDLDSARYHILGAKPWLVFSGLGRNMTITVENQTFGFKADPFDTLRMILKAFNLNDLDLNQSDLPKPVYAGLFGYLAYDLKDCLEKLPRTSIDRVCLPHIYFIAPSIIVVQDKANDTTRLCIPERKFAGKNNLENDLAEFKRIISDRPPKHGSFRGNAGGFKSNFTKAGYMDAIKKIREYIAAGDIYQANMSQRFEMDVEGDTFSLFKSLYKNNPASFFAYIHAGNHQIVSTSPERFLLQTGQKVETRPIKGTRPRGKTPVEDKKLSRELKQSYKDDAELSMIVDLLRNDIGKVCRVGSVRVMEHKRLEAYQNVYHLVSIVEGRLEQGRDSVDLLKATFPGGSITGCPKIRTMEIIDELEPDRRHIYTGSIGYISFHDTMDLSIVIRTATIYNGTIMFSVGGGIVFDSDPLDEYEETLHKGRTLMEVFKGKEKKAAKKDYVWINGALELLDQAAIPVTDQGFQYGYGFFETIRVDKGNPGHLNEHINRFNHTWEHLFAEKPPDLTWDEIINQVIVQNRLLDETAAVKMIATRGDREAPPFNHTLLVLARPYTHRLAGKKEKGLNLAVYPHPRQTPLADHKTLNYLYYFLAGKWAKARNSDEALILNPDKTVSETNTANILLVKNNNVIKPVSLHVLPGIMDSVVCKLLTGWGFTIESRRLFLEDLFAFDEIMITNSLIGAIPVLSIDGKKLPEPSVLWQKINKTLL
ncbi:MAG: aminodeoxychorismate synthase component I [Deltaproteobacteria bacterium]|nr:aminodeoxychorismate synthase component I [Deltaproteobacteria bacterium]MBW2619786.1 aminodeoxychorismate synthase component I [Deltaproteobacteria bacterium]